jgi:FMN reductase
MPANGKFIIGIGGTLRPDSSTERTVRKVLDYAAAKGARTRFFAGKDIDLPMYAPGMSEIPESARRLIDGIRRADAIIIGSPGYHGSVSGLVKNALDYVEELAGDERPYFAGRPIGCVATGAGWQGANATLQALRSIAHALRGWPSSLGVALNSREPLFNAKGEPVHPEVDAQLRTMATQLIEFRGAVS